MHKLFVSALFAMTCAEIHFFALVKVCFFPGFDNRIRFWS